MVATAQKNSTVIAVLAIFNTMRDTSKHTSIKVISQTSQAVKLRENHQTYFCIGFIVHFL